MKSNRINAAVFKDMILNGLNNLKNHEKQINMMNVFPVADKDTGINMRLTLEGAYNKGSDITHLGKYLDQFALGALFSARGNSGVILSQFIKGFAICLSSREIASPHEFTNALIYGYRYAYKSMIKPIEGTLMTVLREGIYKIKNRVRGQMDFQSFFEHYLASLNVSLQNTPNLLPVLKENNVLDSGAYGYIKIIEGVYKYWLDEKIEVTQKNEDIQESIVLNDISPEQKTPYKVVGIVSVCMGKVLKEKFLEYGADIVIDGRSKVEVTKNDFIKAINKINANKIIILPNSEKNVIEANKAVLEIKNNNAIVIPSVSIMSGFYALQMDVPDDGANNRIMAMKSSIQDIDTIFITNRESIISDFNKKLANISSLEDKVACILFFGRYIDSQTKESIESIFKEKYDYLEIQTFEDKDANYSVIGGVF